MTGIATSTLSDWKNGKSTPKLDKLEKIASCLNVDVSHFFDTDINVEIELEQREVEYLKQYIKHLVKIFEDSSENNCSIQKKENLTYSSDIHIVNAVAALVDEIIDNSLDTEDIEKLTSDAKYMGKSKRKNLIYVKNPANTKIPKSDIETIEKRSKKSKKNNRD